MKKLIAIILTAILMSGIIMIPVHAVSEGKIGSALLSVLEKAADDEKIEVWVWTYSEVDIEKAQRLAKEECGLGPASCLTVEDVDLYSKTYNRIINEMETANNTVVLEKLNISDDDIVYYNEYSSSMYLNLTKEQIYTMAEWDEVAGVELRNQEYDESTEDAEPAEGEIYKNLFIRYIETMSGWCELMAYREKYYHTDENGEIDWVFVYAWANEVAPMGFSTTVGGKYVESDSQYYPFIIREGIYVVAEDAFKDIVYVNFDNYDGLYEYYNNLNETLTGDANGDGLVSVLDATRIQRYCAKIISDNMINLSAADVTGDGAVTVLDATRIQRYCAKLCALDGGEYTEE